MSTSTVASPIHSLHAYSESALLLASGTSLYKYNPTTLSVEKTFDCPEGSYAAFLASAADWLFITGGDKYLRVLNAHSLELVAELYSSVHWAELI